MRQAIKAVNAQGSGNKGKYVASYCVNSICGYCATEQANSFPVGPEPIMAERNLSVAFFSMGTTSLWITSTDNALSRAVGKQARYFGHTPVICHLLSYKVRPMSYNTAFEPTRISSVNPSQPISRTRLVCVVRSTYVYIALCSQQSACVHKYRWMERELGVHLRYYYFLTR